MFLIRHYKYIGKTKYKHVYEYRHEDKPIFFINISRIKIYGNRCYSDLRKAAIEADKLLIKNNFPPVNILVSKQKSQSK